MVSAHNLRPFRLFNRKISREIKKGKTLFNKLNLILANKKVLSSCQFGVKLFFGVEIITYSPCFLFPQVHRTIYLGL